MLMLAHRGYWLRAREKNTRTALMRAFEKVLGVETDIRDLNGELVISHDMPDTKALRLEEMLNGYVTAGKPGYLALNIKSDGLTGALHSLLHSYGIRRYFCFDMSVPDTLPYLSAGLNVAARLSEYEPEGALSRRAPMLWVDSFYGANFSADKIAGWLQAGKQICLVSPELHGRSPIALWDLLSSLPDMLRADPRLMLCTDFPLEAQEVLA